MGAVALDRTRTAASDTAAPRAPGKIATIVLRYGISSFGPIAISGAHFLASILFLHALTRAEFGLLSFVFVIVPFCLSLSGALVGASIARVAAQPSGMRDAELATHLKVNLLFSVTAGICVGALLCASHSGLPLASVLACYAAVMTLRWFGRNVIYALGTPLRVAISDIVYAASLIAGLATLFAAHQLVSISAAAVLLVAAVLALAAMGRSLLRNILWPARCGSLIQFAQTWRELARWSALGVLLTELTANAHVYLVTLVFGPSYFALLAIGSLLMRPAVLVLSALPDQERPVMARRIAAGDTAGALRSVKEFRTAAGAVWLATVFLAGAALMWFPHLILKPGYDVGQVFVVLAMWGVITAVRVARTPESVLLQAGGEFRSLAGASGWSCAASLTAAFVLMLAFGPIASLGGILFGELVMTSRIFALSRRWKLVHG